MGEKFRTPLMIQGEAPDAYVHLTKLLEEWGYGDYERMMLYGL